MVDFAALESQYGLPSGLLQAQMMQESGGNPYAVSPAGAMGPAQFMPATAQQYGVTNPYDINQAIPAMAHMDSDLYNKYNGNLPQALAGYNWGQGNVDRQGMANMPPETQNYIASITSKMPQYQNQADPSQMSDEQIKAELSQTQSAQPAPSAMSDADLMNELKGQSSQQSNPDFFQRTANDWQGRNQQAQDINQADVQGGQPVSSTLFQNAGNLAGRFLVDPAMNAAGSLGRAISFGQPTSQNPSGPYNLTDLFQQGMGGIKDAISPYLNPGIQQAASYVQSNPQLARNVSAAGDLAMAAPMVKPLAEGIGSVGSLISDALPAAAEAVPQSAEYLKQSGDNFNAMKDMNLSMGDSEKVMPSIMNSLEDSNVTVANAPQTMNVLKELQDTIETNGDIKLHELEDAKQKLNQIYGGPDGVAANAAKSGIEDFFNDWKEKDPATLMQSAQDELNSSVDEWGKLKTLEQNLTNSVSEKGKMASQTDGDIRQQHINNAADEAKGLSSVRKQIKAQESKIADLKETIQNAPDDALRRQAGANLRERAVSQWNVGKKLQDVEKIRRQAALKNNSPTVIKNKLGSIVTNDRRGRGYKPEEKAAMFSAAKPSRVGAAVNAAVSKRLLPLAFAMHGDIPAALATGAGNELMNILAKRSAANKLNDISRMIVKNRPIPPQMHYAP